MKTRLTLSEADALAGRVLAALQPLAERAEVAGSIRRRRPEVGDIDIVLIPKPLTFPGAAAAALKRSLGAEPIRGGPRMASLTVEAAQLDLYAATRATWGVSLLRWTGSADHNVRLCLRARSLGLRLAVSEGVTQGGRVIASESEEAIFTALGLPYAPPEMRT